MRWGERRLNTSVQDSLGFLTACEQHEYNQLTLAAVPYSWQLVREHQTYPAAHLHKSCDVRKFQPFGFDAQREQIVAQKIMQTMGAKDEIAIDKESLKGKAPFNNHRAVV